MKSLKLNISTLRLVGIGLIPFQLFSQDSVRGPINVFDYIASESIKAKMYYSDNANLSAINAGLEKQLILQKDIIEKNKSILASETEKGAMYQSQIQDLNQVIKSKNKTIVKKNIFIWGISAVSISSITYLLVKR